ncbi:class I SAM-dependent methyltransferase [Noviherbaspirillum pedocola]|uniref:Class I SAM-dependent methyltransferase n=1 Tax=Noviherbaspirillum pedocola TaxID=2801341 RepID=A0A934T0P6_9BURK|nr:class I SAM-dependent methyltransferase [Noviherbaspirillum pedocola]MBK4738860.1 class I SAM-dependent methyltransferase [Noviherbaspirillum pedocola]
MTPSPCPICASPSTALDVVDFNYNLTYQQRTGKRLELAGVPVYYYMCATCDFTFSPQFQSWSDADFLEKVYNAHYLELDPDYVEARPSANAALLMSVLAPCKAQIRHLDYGGGNGRLAALLRDDGWDSLSHDPFPASDTRLDALGKFNLITAFEVFEHVPDPNALMATLAHLLDARGVVLFSTATSDGYLRRDERIDWWYCSPRVGHISLYAKKSLALLGERHGFMLASFNDDWHCYARQAPDWFHHLAG